MYSLRGLRSETFSGDGERLGRRSHSKRAVVTAVNVRRRSARRMLQHPAIDKRSPCRNVTKYLLLHNYVLLVSCLVEHPARGEDDWCG